jgi:hypothetical protein
LIPAVPFAASKLLPSGLNTSNRISPVLDGSATILNPSTTVVATATV